MSIIKPEVVWVDGRCYRVSDKSAWPQGKELGAYEEEAYEPDCILNDEEICDSDQIIQIRGNRYMYSFHVNSNFYCFIIGAKGATLKRLSAETNCIISIPRVGEDGKISISGANKRDIVTAKHRIDILIETSRCKLEFTHFVCTLLNTDEIKENFLNFKKQVLIMCGKGPRAITEKLFQNPERIHLTIDVLVLLDEEERKKAVEALETCKTDIIIPFLEENGPLHLELKGLDYMNDDPSEVKILYAQVLNENDCVQNIANKIRKHFIDLGLTKRKEPSVKLHVTLMNSSFIDRDETKPPQNFTFDVTNILEVFKDYYFGRTLFSTLHICQRHVTGEETYHTTSKIDFDIY